MRVFHNHHAVSQLLAVSANCVRFFFKRISTAYILCAIFTIAIFIDVIFKIRYLERINLGAKCNNRLNVT